MAGDYRVHRRVPLDINGAELHYLNEGGSKLADQVPTELFEAFQGAADHPTKVHYDILSRCRRGNLNTRTQ